MGVCNRPLNWVEHNGPARGFHPRKVRSATTSLGVYEIFQNGQAFDVWLNKNSNDTLVFLGSSETANGARQMCERNFRNPH